ncbi:hypothetical protein Nit79A3_2418 [Nitrosomonas sp. Is79A3]|uniref:hypothetical protein n=1 Tax=Nitrosomonas sp. (strain Is79A3) TaxID=261292 RepID=UPI000215CA33
MDANFIVLLSTAFLFPGCIFIGLSAFLFIKTFCSPEDASCSQVVNSVRELDLKCGDVVVFETASSLTDRQRTDVLCSLDLCLNPKYKYVLLEGGITLKGIVSQVPPDSEDNTLNLEKCESSEVKEG